jgi:hypothetical protein
MRRLRIILQAITCAALVTSGVARAEGGDSSADAGEAFTQAVRGSKGVVIRVPINERGEELTDAADVRLYMGELSPTQAQPGEISTAYESALPINDAPEVTDEDISRDSSTWGWRLGWGRGCGWRSNYYYSYRPSYYWGGSYYSYGNPCYNSYYGGYSYGGYSYYGYRDYYYPYY